MTSCELDRDIVQYMDFNSIMSKGPTGWRAQPRQAVCERLPGPQSRLPLSDPPTVSCRGCKRMLGTFLCGISTAEACCRSGWLIRGGASVPRSDYHFSMTAAVSLCPDNLFSGPWLTWLCSRRTGPSPSRPPSPAERTPAAKTRTPAPPALQQGRTVLSLYSNTHTTTGHEPFTGGFPLGAYPLGAEWI